jgi:hypothetical protein
MRQIIYLNSQVIKYGSMKWGKKGV